MFKMFCFSVTPHFFNAFFTNRNNSNTGLACELIFTKIFQFISMMCKFIDKIVIFILFHVKVPKGVYSLCKVLQKEVCHNFYALLLFLLQSYFRVIRLFDIRNILQKVKFS